MVPGVVVLSRYDRPFFIFVVKNAFAIVVNRMQQGIVAIFIAIVQIGILNGKTFIEIEFAPVFAGHKITEPLVH